MNQNGGRRSAAWQPTDDDDRHIRKTGGEGRNQAAAAATEISGGQRSQGTTAHRGNREDMSQDWREEKKRGGGEIPEGCKVERRGCCRRSGAEEGRDGGKKGKERSRASTPSQSYTPFPQSPPTGVSALVRARGDRRTSAQHGPVGTRTRTHAKHRNNTSEPKVLNKLWTTGGGKKRKNKTDKVLPEKVTMEARRSPPAARRPLAV